MDDALAPTSSTNCKSYEHVSPPPPRWSHNACGPESIQEVGGMLLRCVNGLRPQLLPATTRSLDALTKHRNQDAAITENTPWQLVHKCDCSRCARDGATAQDNYVERELYKHMNRHRTLKDETFEELGPYTVGSFTDVRRMFEAYLGLRTLSHPHHALPGLGLCVEYKCVKCGTTTRPPGMLEVQASGIARPFPGMPKTCTTQQIVDQTIGKDCLLDYLPEDEETQLATVQRWGSRCPEQCIRSDHSRVWADTMLPSKLDNQQPLPPLLRVTKGLYNNRLSAVSDTITVTHNGDEVTYKLLACVYGNTHHFTACIRYHIDEGDEQFYHFDPFHFEEERLLPLSDNRPACMGGKPNFQPHHTNHMRKSFRDNTHLRNVAAAIYGIVACPQQDAEMIPGCNEALINGDSAELSLPSDMHDCEQCLAERQSQLCLWTCSMCTFDNSLPQDVCVICNTNRPAPLWTCASCTYDNNSTKRECVICKTDRPAAPMSSPTGPLWTCSSCTFNNPLTNKQCAICATDQPAPLWTCPSCTFHNPLTNEQCASCAADQPTASMSSPTVSTAQAPLPSLSTSSLPWTCTSCTYDDNKETDQMCTICDVERPVSWRCLTCGNDDNTAADTECDICDQRRPVISSAPAFV